MSPLRMSSTSCCCFSLKLSSALPSRIVLSSALTLSMACCTSPHWMAFRMAMRSDTVSRSTPAAGGRASESERAREGGKLRPGGGLAYHPCPTRP